MQQINNVTKKFYLIVVDFNIMFERKLFKKSMKIIQINASFSFSRQTRIINYFKFITSIFSINQKLINSRISLKLKSFKNELFKINDNSTSRVLLSTLLNQ